SKVRPSARVTLALTILGIDTLARSKRSTMLPATCYSRKRAALGLFVHRVLLRGKCMAPRRRRADRGRSPLRRLHLQSPTLRRALATARSTERRSTGLVGLPRGVADRPDEQAKRAGRRSRPKHQQPDLLRR